MNGAAPWHRPTVGDLHLAAELYGEERELEQVRLELLAAGAGLRRRR